MKLFRACLSQNGLSCLCMYMCTLCVCVYMCAYIHYFMYVYLYVFLCVFVWVCVCQVCCMCLREKIYEVIQNWIFQRWENACRKEALSGKRKKFRSHFRLSHRNTMTHFRSGKFQKLWLLTGKYILYIQKKFSFLFTSFVLSSFVLSSRKKMKEVIQRHTHTHIYIHTHTYTQKISLSLPTVHKSFL